MSIAENKAVIRSLYEAYNRHNVALLDKFLTPDYVHHAQNLRGLESVKQYEAMIHKGFPDLHDTIKDIIAEGDKVDRSIDWVLLNTQREQRSYSQRMLRNLIAQLLFLRFEIEFCHLRCVI